MQQVDGMSSSFEPHKSTKGASKMRRDLINTEIANLRDLLPLPSSTRQRLSQLQLMALVCVYVRKSNYFQQVFKRHHELGHPYSTPNIGFSKGLSGFLIMMTQNGKLLYISDNAAEYLGHSMEDLLIHGDSVYDIIDKADHGAVQNELLRSTSTHSPPGMDDTRLFLCRMNVSRNARRQMRFGDQKVVLVEGHYLSYLPLCSRNEPVFIAMCTPVAMPETRECVVQGATNVFTSVHSIDMKFMHIDRNGEYYLGYTRSDINGLSWYQLIHWSFMKEAQSKHRLISQSDQEKSCILLLRLQTRGGEWIWVHCVLQVKEGTESQQQSQQQQSIVVATNQILSEREAEVMRNNSWIYHYYTVQTKLQYGLAYAETSTAPGSPTAVAAAHRLAAAATYFPAATKLVNNVGHQTPPYHHHPHHLYQTPAVHPSVPETPTAYAPIPLHSPAHQNGIYNPPPPHPYHHSFDLRNGKESPLDFSLTSAPPVYEFPPMSSGYSSAYWAHHYHGYHRPDEGSSSLSTVSASATSPQSWQSSLSSSSSTVINGGSSGGSQNHHHHNHHQQAVHHQASLNPHNSNTTTAVSDTSPGSSVIICGSKRSKRMKKSVETVGESDHSEPAARVSSVDVPYILGREGTSRSSRGYGGIDVLTLSAPSFGHSSRPRKLLGSAEDEPGGTMEEESMTLACSLTPSPVWEGHNHRVPDLQLRHGERDQVESSAPPNGDLTHRVPNMEVWNAGRLQFG